MVRDLEQLKGLIGSNDGAQIAKALTVTSGFIGINLEPVAKLMMPFITVLRNMIPTDTPKMGGQTAQWRMQLGYGSFNFGTSMGTAFGGVGAATTGSALTIQADYKSQAVNGGVQFEAIPMAREFDDPMQIETARSLSALLRLDEVLVLGANEAAIAAPVAAATVPSGTGGVLATATYYAYVTALTLQGAITNAAGTNSNVGESVVSNEVTAAVVSGGSTGSFTLSWGAVPGAIAYKVYVGTVTTTEKLLEVSKMKYADGTAISKTVPTYVTVTKVVVTNTPAGGQPANPGAVDGSANANVFEGLIAWAGKSTIYGQAVGTKIAIDQQGAKLTSTNAGITEFDTLLSSLWETWNISPTLIVCSAASASHLTAQLVAPNPLAYRIDVPNEPNSMGKLTGGLFVGGYLNKFAASVLPGQSAIIPVIAHPYMTDGTYLFLTERIPYLYSREARGFALDVQTPYTYFELGRTDRSFPFSLFFTETLKCYHPLVQCVITGVRVE